MKPQQTPGLEIEQEFIKNILSPEDMSKVMREFAEEFQNIASDMGVLITFIESSLYITGVFFTEEGKKAGITKLLNAMDNVYGDLMASDAPVENVVPIAALIEYFLSALKLRINSPSNTVQ
jgi:hypothetical protein